MIVIAFGQSLSAAKKTMEGKESLAVIALRLEEPNSKVFLTLCWHRRNNSDDSSVVLAALI